MTASGSSLWRTLLILGRVSNLPTVWSNCLAAWLIAGGGSVQALVGVTLGACLLYVGGMYLNDAFDADYDRRHRANRPIPRGDIRESVVWALGLALLAGGAGAMLLGANVNPWLVLLLAGAILGYDAVHKFVSFSPVLMALCRILLFLAASSTGHQGITGLAVWTAIALGCWIIGLSYLAKRESLTFAALSAWPLILLAAPVALATLVNSGESRGRAVGLSLLLIVWTWRCVRRTFGGPVRNVGQTVSGLLAGICLVDLLAVAPAFPWGSVFIACFGLSLVAQRYVPAT